MLKVLFQNDRAHSGWYHLLLLTQEQSLFWDPKEHHNWTGNKMENNIISCKCCTLSPLPLPTICSLLCWSYLLDTGNRIRLKNKWIKNNQLPRLPKRKKKSICTAVASRSNPWHQKGFILPSLNSQFEISPAVATKATCSEQQSRQQLPFSLSLGGPWWSHRCLLRDKHQSLKCGERM